MLRKVEPREHISHTYSNEKNGFIDDSCAVLYSQCSVFDIHTLKTDKSAEVKLT